MNSKKVTEFGKLITNQQIRDYLSSQSFSKPTDVQNSCIPQLLLNKNVSVQGKTGSGKTLGFLIPLIQKLKDADEKAIDDQPGEPKAVIILPTRELALQVFGITKSISHFAKLRVRKLVGGDKGKPLVSLYSSKMDILIATPDRCLRAFKNQELSKDSLKYLILDEADQLLEPSFRKTMGEVASLLTNKQLQVVLVSASRPINFDQTIEECFPGTPFVTVGKGEENVLNHKVNTFNIPVEEDDKFLYVNNFLKKVQKTNGLIFTGNKARAHKVYKQLQEDGYKKLHLLHKDLDRKDRIEVVEKFRQKGGILVATDIFARGIDIEHLKWVLNFDLPSDADYYLHRSGRVGRAGRSGDVYNFITSKDGARQNRINTTLQTQGRADLRIKHSDKKQATQSKAAKKKVKAARFEKPARTSNKITKRTINKKRRK